MGEVARLYDAGMSTRQIGARLGAAGKTIQRRMKRDGIPRRAPGCNGGDPGWSERMTMARAAARASGRPSRTQRGRLAQQERSRARAAILAAAAAPGATRAGIAGQTGRTYSLVCKVLRETADVQVRDGRHANPGRPKKNA